MSEKLKVPVSGWKLGVYGDNMVVVLGNSIPFYEGNILIPDQVTANPLANVGRARDNKKENHCFVIQTSPEANERFKDRFPVGTRVMVQGTMTPVTINGKTVWICRMIDVQCVITREDGSPDPEWVAMKKDWFDVSPEDTKQSA